MAAGPGNLEVTVNGGRVPTAAAAQGAHTYAISFTPRDPRPHTVELRFNGDHVPGEGLSIMVSFSNRSLSQDKVINLLIIHLKVMIKNEVLLNKIYKKKRNRFLHIYKKMSMFLITM